MSADERTQYENIKTVNVPPAKQGGQFGPPETDSPAGFPANSTSTKAASGGFGNSATHVTAAEKIRFGQAMSEQGGGIAGGETGAGYTGRADNEGGYGGTESLERGSDAVHGVEGEGVHSGRRAQGYGGTKDMGKDIGA